MICGTEFAVSYSGSINQICRLERKIMAEENGTGSNVIWALTTLLIVAMIVGALYYSGFLGGTKKQQIDVEISSPGR